MREYEHMRKLKKCNIFNNHFYKILFIISLFLFYAESVNADILTVHFLDVGQGLCVYAECDGETMLYDGGSRDSADFVVAYLKQQKVEKIDYLICSHFDEDHMAGLIGCMHVFEVGCVMLPEYQKESDLYNSFISVIEEKNCFIRYSYVGDQYPFGTGLLYVLGPERIVDKDNNNSICIRLEKEHHSFLFTGDAESDEEADLVRENMDIKSTVYCAGHHGSASSSSEKLLAAIMPESVVISCGKGNTYGHPHEEMLSRLEDTGIDVFRTDLQGSIIAVTDGNEIFWNQEPCNDYSGGNEINVLSDIDSEIAQGQGVDYILNINSKKIHDPSCHSVMQMSEKNKQHYHGLIDDLFSMGYTLCHECNAQLSHEVAEKNHERQINGETESADYIANMGTKKFHQPDCSSADDIKESNKYYYSGSREGLIEQGFQPCKRCYP